MDLVSIVFLQIDFPIKKHYFLISVIFLCLHSNLRDCSIQCMLSTFYHEDRKLTFRVRRGMQTYQLVLYGLCIFQVRLDVHS